MRGGIRLASGQQTHERQYSPWRALLAPAHLMLLLSWLACRPPHVPCLPPGTGSNTHTRGSIWIVTRTAALKRYPEENVLV
jgi:hypothetical protein